MKGATLHNADIHRPKGVSIHAPNEGSDFEWDLADANLIVSIHAPNEGSDMKRFMPATNLSCFNPRSQ